MSELKSDQQIACIAKPLAMRGKQLFAKADEIGERVGIEQKLIGIRPAVVPDGDRLTAPDELRPAAAEISPPPPRQL